MDAQTLCPPSIEACAWRRKEVIGDCTLYLGDCLVVMPVVGKVDAVVTDPPYGIRADVNAARNKGRFGWRDYGSTNWDRYRPEACVFEEILRISKEQIIWGGNYFADVLPPRMRWLVWDKGQRNFSLADVELAWTSQQNAARIFTLSRSRALLDGKRHPTQKPIAIMEWCLGFIPDAQVILDPFMGSGTTLVACAKMGRKGIGIELDPAYFDIACRRVEAAYSQPDLFVTATADLPQQNPLL